MDIHEAYSNIHQIVCCLKTLTLHDPSQGEILERKRDSVMYRTWHEPMLASMGMSKAILYNTCGI